jgi:DNA polymerase
VTDLRAEAQSCHGCELWRRATQTVFGEGPETARVMLVGEQPGDAEDREGHPFVGPAGRLLDRAIAAAGLDRRDVYITNVVKHFKWEEAPPPRGKRRLHSRPSTAEVRACRPWLDGELDAIRPAIVVCLGASAAQAILGTAFRVTSQRGVWTPSPIASSVIATVHPSSILRERDDARRHAAFAQFVADLTLVVDRLRAS